MEDPNEHLKAIPELYFLIAKFLSGGPLKETAKTLLKELESVEVLPRRLDWLGDEHAQSYNELASQYTEMSWQRLATVCQRALMLAPTVPLGTPGAPPQSAANDALRLSARLSLLSESLVRPKPKYSVYKKDHSLVRRVMSRELGSGSAQPGVHVQANMFPPRMLAGLQLQRRTLGHLSAVYCLVFDCTGRYVITGADDLLVKVWSAVDGRLLQTLRGAGAEITDVCVSKDGALLACGSVERLVRVWCLATGAPRAVLHAHAGTITSVHWAPPARNDLRWLASTSTDGSVAFWTCSPDGQFLSQPVQYVERMRPGACHMICAAWSAGGAFLAAGSADHHVRVYAVEGAGPRRVLETAVHGEAVDSLAWAHRGLRFVSGSKDGAAALWSLHATQWRHVLLRCRPEAAADPAKRLKVTMVCWDRSDAYVITAVSDNTIRVWCSRTCVQTRSLRGHRDEAYVLEAHPCLAGVLLSAGHDGQLFVWDAHTGEEISSFHNHIEGQGDGAIFDAKWAADGAHVAASDSHGHLLLLGLGAGHRLLKMLPTELFFHTDYRPLVRDALGGALDEQTETPPHLMPPPFLVDVEGAPHAPEFQRLVPGRENLSLSQLIPAADATRTRLDAMIEALAAERSGGGGGFGEARGVWRGEGVRHTGGSWQRGDEPPAAPARPAVPPLRPASRERAERDSAEMHAFEQSWYRREMRRRPVMISTANGDAPSGPRRRPGRARAPPRPRATQPQVTRVEEPPSVESSGSDTSDESVRLSGEHSRSSRSTHSSIDLTDSSSSSSSQYSDWEAGAALAPPARARRRPVQAKRYSPSTVPTQKRPERSTAASSVPANSTPATSSIATPSGSTELPEAYRPGEWLTAVSPRKAPYHPQMGDHCLYFRLGHQRYFEAVAEKDLYKLNPRDKPWERTHVYECEVVKVVGIKYAIKPPRVACLRLACSLCAPRSLTVRYHDMPDVIDFLVLRQQYAAAVARGWSSGDRFRCMIDDSWWTGVVLENSNPTGGAGSLPDEGPPPCSSPDEAQQWASAAASHFLSLRVRWDNGEVERLSPWDLEPLDPERLPSEPGGAVPVLPHELEAALYRAEAHEWPPRGERAAACRAIAHHINQVMSLSVAEPFVAPVDLQLYPSYALVVPYPIDLATIKARFENLFYRRTAAAQFDVRYLASNAEQFNRPHSPIVRQARLVTDLLLYIISHWREVDVVAQYHELAASYRSSDDEPLAHTATHKSRRNNNQRASKQSAQGWSEPCAKLLRELCASTDAEPFREPVSTTQAPDYHAVISRPMDLGSVRTKLENNEYTNAEQFAADVRLVFTNSRLYNTNKRSRIYSMTVRLSALFEALWSRVQPTVTSSGRRTRTRRTGAREAARTRRAARATRTATQHTNGAASAAPASDTSDSETLAATSRRVHAARASPDSDAPLNAHRKGKGVGKKSKSSSNSTEPVPSTSATRDEELYEPENGVQSGSEGEAFPAVGSDSSAYSNIQVLEEELVEDEVELTYDDGSGGGTRRTATSTDQSGRRASRKRRRLSSDSTAPSRGRRRRKRTRTPVKIRRERFASAASSSSSSSAWSRSAADDAGRYESDRSYRPRYSTDDDAPLHIYRQRQEGADAEAGPSSSRTHNGHARTRGSGGVSLRARRSPRRYNEDSDEDSAGAISKRRPPPATRRRHVTMALPSASRRLHTDHNYFNGHASRGNEPHPSEPSTANAVSISSRGRVRKLTAKARGLLTE